MFRRRLTNVVPAAVKFSHQQNKLFSVEVWHTVDIILNLISLKFRRDWSSVILSETQLSIRKPVLELFLEDKLINQ